jgi:Beta-lactamase
MSAHVLSEGARRSSRNVSDVLPILHIKLLSLRFFPEIDAASANPTTLVPGFVACVINKDGKIIFSNAWGKRGVNSSEPMTLDSVFWIASWTEMIDGIIYMQLVEQGKLSLDDADLAEKLCPELKEVKIFKGGKLVEKKSRISLRRLLLQHILRRMPTVPKILVLSNWHTKLFAAGYGYTFFSPEIRDFGLPEGFDEFSGLLTDMKQPITFESGTNRRYGASEHLSWPN